MFKRATLKNHGARNNKHSSVDADADWSLIVYSRALKNIDTTQKILFPFKHKKHHRFSRIEMRSTETKRLASNEKNSSY